MNGVGVAATKLANSYRPAGVAVATADIVAALRGKGDLMVIHIG